MKSNARNELLPRPFAPSVARQNDLEGNHNFYLGRCFNYKSNVYIRHGFYNREKFVITKRRNPFRKQHSTQIKKLSDTVVKREDDEMQREAWRGRRKRYEYFERLTNVCLVRGLSVNIGRVKEKGNEAQNTLKEYERKWEILCMDC